MTAVIIYKNPFMVNGQPVAVSLALGEGVACNTIFSWPFLQTIKVSKLTDDNTLVIGLMGEKFNMEMLVTQRANEAPKTSEGMSIQLPESHGLGVDSIT